MEESRTQVILCISSTVLKLLLLKTATIKVGNTSVKCLHSSTKRNINIVHRSSPSAQQ